MHAAIYVDDWRADVYNSAEISSLGIKIVVAPPVKGGALITLSEAV